MRKTDGRAEPGRHGAGTKKDYTRKSAKSHLRALPLIVAVMLLGIPSADAFDWKGIFARKKAADRASISSKHRIRAGQYLVIRISAPSKPTQTEVLRVDPEGMIYHSGAGAIRVADFTVEETEKLIRNQIPGGSDQRMSIRISVLEDQTATKSLS